MTNFEKIMTERVGVPVNDDEDSSTLRVYYNLIFLSCGATSKEIADFQAGKITGQELTKKVYARKKSG